MQATAKKQSFLYFQEGVGTNKLTALSKMKWINYWSSVVQQSQMIMHQAKMAMVFCMLLTYKETGNGETSSTTSHIL